MNSLIHPALWQLTVMRMRGRLRTMQANFTQPKRVFISILGTVLAAIWLSNVIASVLFREPYDPRSLSIWMTFMLTLYAGWHLIRVCWQRPENSIEWSPAERNNLLSSPFTREQLVQYRLATVLGVTTLKAAIGTVLLLPDLELPLLGFLAMWCALAFIELIRLISDTFAAGLSRRSYRLMQGVVVGGVGLLGTWGCVLALNKTHAADPASKVPVLFQFMQNAFTVAKDSVQTPVGEWITAPFSVFVSVMTMREFSVEILLATLAGFSLLVIAVWLLLRLDVWCETANVIRQKEFNAQGTHPSRESLQQSNVQFRLPIFEVKACGGAVIWRQLVGVYRYGTGVCLALIPPAILSAMPLYMTRLDDRMAIINFMGGLVFYSFLLLPSALKFDFRRDYSHLLLLKLLPMAPWRVVCGQLVTPILITTLFQYAMLFLASQVREISPEVLVAALLSFPAMNFAVYGWENLMFLLFPQKLKQEGIEVFLRTTVLFTAKGLTCAIVFAMVFCWALLSHDLSTSLKQIIPLLGDHRLVFGLGIWISVTGVGIIMTLLAARQFRLLETIPESQGG